MSRPEHIEEAINIAAAAIQGMTREQKRVVLALMASFRDCVDGKNERIAILEGDIDAMAAGLSSGCEECGMNGVIVACGSCGAHRECRSGGY